MVQKVTDKCFTLQKSADIWCSLYQNNSLKEKTTMVSIFWASVDHMQYNSININPLIAFKHVSTRLWTGLCESSVYMFVSCLTLRYGFHDVQKAHEETAGLRLVQLVTTRTVAYEGLWPCKLRRNTQTEKQSKTYC